MELSARAAQLDNLAYHDACFSRGIMDRLRAMHARTTVGENVAPAKRPAAVFAAVIGNGLEWYNFMLYGVFADIIARLYFHVAGPLLSLLLSLGTFSAGFLMRPLGGAFLGMYSDRNGRKAALSLTILLMCIGTAMISLMPSYEQIGIAAPILLVAARLVQGFSTGGELGNATAYMHESAPPGRSGYFVSWVLASSALFIALGLAIGALATHSFSPSVLETWGWRVPFFFGLLIGPIGYVLRSRITELPSNRRTHDNQARPFHDVTHEYRRELLASCALITLSTISTYVLQVYTPIYAVRSLGLPQSAGLIATMVGAITAGTLMPIVGHFVDTLGPRIFLRGATVAFIVLAWPMFHSISNSPSLTLLLVYQIVFGIVIAVYQGSLLSAVCDLFPDQSLATALGLSGNIAISIFGGSAALVITWLIAVTGSNLVPAVYLMVGGALGLLGTVGMRR
jgi:MHS family proline/betaine transporter-like MFS transporter